MRARCWGEGVSIRGALVRIREKTEERAHWDRSAVGDNPFFCPDAAAVGKWADYLDPVRKAGWSAGTVIQIVAEGVPAGLGEPVHGKLDGDLAASMMSTNAVKGVEMGDGFAAAAKRGEAAHDKMAPVGYGGVAFISNNAGGVPGGISPGQSVVARFAVKPTSSIPIPRQGVTEAVEIITTGGHDPSSASAPCRSAKR